MKRTGRTRGGPSPLFFVRAAAKGLNPAESGGCARVDSKGLARLGQAGGPALILRRLGRAGEGMVRGVNRAYNIPYSNT